MPTTVEEVEKLSWGQLLYLAGENAESLGINGIGSPSSSSSAPSPSSARSARGPGRGSAGAWSRGSARREGTGRVDGVSSPLIDRVEPDLGYWVDYDVHLVGMDEQQRERPGPSLCR